MVWRHGSIRVGRKKEHAKELKFDTRQERWNSTVKETEGVSLEKGAPAAHALGQLSLLPPA